MVNQLSEDNPSGVSRSGLEARIADVDKQISVVDKQLQDANANVAKSAAIPGAVVQPPQYHNDGPPEAFWLISALFIVVVLLPISIAFARRIWKKGANAVTALPNDIAERFGRLEQAVDSIAVEVERIGEGQRFVTRVMSERGNALGAGAAQPIDVPQGERARVGERKI